MIVDAHTHVSPEPGGMGHGYNASVAYLLENLDACSVDKAMIAAEDVDVPYIKPITNRFVGECCAQHPDRFIGFGAMHPLTPDAPKRFEDDVRRYGLQGLKLHPRFQGVGADDERIVPLVEKAVELDLPIAIDAFLWKPTPLTLQLPINIDTLCKRVPEARIIMCHAGGYHFLDALAVVGANDNVYLEFSTALTYFYETPFEDQFMFALRKAGRNRIIYGSDHPQDPIKSCYDRSRAIFEKHGYSEEDLSYVFGKTFLSTLPGAQRLPRK